MSDNVFNIYYAINDKDIHNIKNIRIEFVKNFVVENNEMPANKVYNYSPLPNTTNAYLPVEFWRKDMLGYMKIRNKNIWLYEKHGSLYFDRLSEGSFYYQQPLVLWFDYIRDSKFVAYKYVGSNLDALMKHTYNRVNNVQYIKYQEADGDIFVSWVSDINQATKFIVNRLDWSEQGWMKLYDDKASLFNKYHY
jgi:hypothetical protein